MSLFTPLMYLATFGWVLAFFASAVAGIVWLATKAYRALTEPESELTKQAEDNRAAWNPNEWKRAGQ